MIEADKLLLHRYLEHGQWGLAEPQSRKSIELATDHLIESLTIHNISWDNRDWLSQYHKELSVRLQRASEPYNDEPKPNEG